MSVDQTVLSGKDEPQGDRKSSLPKYASHTLTCLYRFLVISESMHTWTSHYNAKYVSSTILFGLAHSTLWGIEWATIIDLYGKVILLWNVIQIMLRQHFLRVGSQPTRLWDSSIDRQDIKHGWGMRVEEREPNEGGGKWWTMLSLGERERGRHTHTAGLIEVAR